MEKISKSKDRKLNYISLFSSAGVGCFGFKQNDFECIATNEIIERRLEVQKYNNKCKYKSGYISGDITNKETQDKIFNEISFWKTKEKIKDVDVLIATPPCQGMSVANHKKKDELNRNSLVIESIKIVNKISPKFFIFENVRAFLNTACTDIDGQIKTINESISLNLSGKYNIVSKVINFKDIGVPSSRTRTLVIGVRKDLKEITPYDLFPEIEDTKTIRQVIGDLPPLREMGEIYNKDIYHNYKKYDKRMQSWVMEIKEGESAFDNKDPKKRPHRLVDGKIIYNVNKNGDKYKRCKWDNVGPCIHTRNDIFASQSTIHPNDNRVFSIRELMRLMTIPTTFKWVDESEKQLNLYNYNVKKEFLSKNEMNIRQSIGEAVPTLVFNKIAKNIQKVTKYNFISENESVKFVQENSLDNIDNMINFIKTHKKLNFFQLSKISEFANAKRTDTAAYYTSQDVCFSIIKDLPDFENQESVKILEPSVGSGNFLPLLINKYRMVKNVIIDVMDINSDSIKILKELVKKLDVPKNIQINYINDDFLLHNFNNFNASLDYDLVVGNPPFMKIKDSKKLKIYKQNNFNKKTNNLFAFFIEKALLISKHVALITPKSLISTPEFNQTRELLEKKNVLKICDYGETAFKVKIETISFIVSNTKAKNKLIKLESYITNDVSYKEREYVMSKSFPYWLIYRDSFFDKVAKSLKFEIFNHFRDRTITKKHTSNNGKIRVLKSRNLSQKGDIIDIDGYDSYINNINELSVSKFINKENLLIIPNLSYYPRASFLPKNAIADGSLAILTPKNGTKIKQEDLNYYATDEFRKFYRIARNFGTRSLNIDNNSIFFWGVKNES
ncbi:DNA (cytosine-5-)-methyltransferase [Candidatus Woesearchaeota archaeon]|nr:DNA (cytosine-5-)-methyltransferase [Candidatus Woesearchaeota archaeon]